MISRAGRRVRASARIGRFGPRSLAARLLVVVVVPMIGLQVFAYREVQHQRAAANSAAIVRAQVALLQRSGRLMAPLYVELVATDGLTRAEEIGIDRTELASILGVDLPSMLTQARIDLSAGLDAMGQSSNGVVLRSGTVVAERITELKGELATLRGVDERLSVATLARAASRYARLLATAAG